MNQNSYLTWQLRRPFTSVRDGKGQEWIQESYEEQAAEGYPVHDDGGKPGWESAAENFRLSSLRIAHFIYHPVTSSSPPKKN